MKYGEWNMGQTEALLNRLGGIDVALRMLGQEFKVVFTSILNWLGNLVLPATTEKFVASEKFVLNTTDTAKTKISYLDGDFKSWFLDKIEESAGEEHLRYGDLAESANDEKILAELGGEAKAETTLAVVYALMLKQPKGGKGTLLNNAYANIFYVRDATGVLRTVRVLWHGGGWDVLAYSIDDPSGWRAESRVFSRN